MASSSIPDNPFLFDSGDVRIRVTYREKQIVGKVCSSSMVLASPVWKKFIFPPFPQLRDNESTSAAKEKKISDEKSYRDLKRFASGSTFETVFSDKVLTEEELAIMLQAEERSEPESEHESKAALHQYILVRPTKTGPQEETRDAVLKSILDDLESDNMVNELDFSDDNGRALLLLLQIAHLQFRRVPADIDFQLLHQVAVLCDLYDCVGLVQPWVEGWIMKDGDLLVSPWSGMHEPHDQWIFIAWVFGKEEIFKKCAGWLPIGVTVDQHGGCFYNGRPLDPYMPDGLLESIKAIRLYGIKRLLDIPYTQANDIAAFNSPLPPGALDTNSMTQCVHFRKECDAMIYGSLTLALYSLDLWPQKNPESITMSIMKLAGLLKTNLEEKNIHHVQNHAGCNTNHIASRVVGIMLTMPDTTLAAHREHMRIQREKLAFLVFD